jgi:hypothetical protein
MMGYVVCCTNLTMQEKGSTQLERCDRFCQTKTSPSIQVPTVPEKPDIEQKLLCLHLVSNETHNAAQFVAIGDLELDLSMI